MHEDFDSLAANIHGNVCGRMRLQHMMTPDLWNNRVPPHMGSFIPGHHAPVQFVFGSLNDISDGYQYDLEGLGGARRERRP
eukprot:6488856-Pyramimonas_sp.AAC.2